MGNINLLDDYKKKEAEKNNVAGHRGQKWISSGLIISLSVLVLTFLVWGGMLLWNKNLEAKSKSMDDQIKNEESNLRGADASRVLDFKQRLDEIASSFEQKRDASEALKKVEKLVVPGVVTKSLKLEGDSLVAILSADNFGNLSKQIFNFKKESSEMKNAKVSDVKKDATGSIGFTVRADVNK
jgi:Tfp pilus assembly protein PilN